MSSINSVAGQGQVAPLNLFDTAAGYTGHLAAQAALQDFSQRPHETLAKANGGVTASLIDSSSPAKAEEFAADISDRGNAAAGSTGGVAGVGNHHQLGMEGLALINNGIADLSGGTGGH